MEAITSSAWKIIPQFHSRSIPATIDFYTKQLGFTLGGVHTFTDTDTDTNINNSNNNNNNNNNNNDDDPAPPTPEFCSIYMGHKAAANIYFFLCAPSDTFHPSQAMIALGTTQLDEYYELLRSKGMATVRIVEPIADESWGYRQFTVEDWDGNRVTFFRFLEGGNPGEV